MTPTLGEASRLAFFRLRSISALAGTIIAPSLRRSDSRSTKSIAAKEGDYWAFVSLAASFGDVEQGI
jgi:hypothetical protein